MAQILIVEDESIVAKDIQDRLRRQGYKVPMTAYSSKDALEKVAETQPDLILMDIRLRGPVDGIETALMIRERYNIPIVYLTAHADDKTLKRAKKTQPYGYILKPFNEKELHSTIEMALYRHDMEHKLQESQRWLAATLKSIGDAVIATDASGKITFMNAMAESLTGWLQREATGKESNEIFHLKNEKTAQEIENPISLVLKDGKVSGLTKNTLLVSKNKNEVPIAASTSAIKDGRGKITGVVLVFRDIIKHKEQEAKQKETHEELKRLNQIKSHITAMVSHELKSPLMAVKEGIELVLEGNEGPITEEQKDTLDIASRNVDRMGRLISNVLDFFKYSSGKMDIFFQEINLNELASEVYRLMRPSAQKKGLYFLLEIQNKNEKIWCDADQIKQVLINLIDNAIKYTPISGEIAVTLSNKTKDDVLIEVRDNGMGIKEEDQERIFSKFEQLGQAGGRKNGGVGLGLAICKEIIGQHNGDIFIESILGKGTKFKVRLPVKQNLLEKAQ